MLKRFDNMVYVQLAVVLAERTGPRNQGKNRRTKRKSSEVYGDEVSDPDEDKYGCSPSEGMWLTAKHVQSSETSKQNSLVFFTAGSLRSQLAIVNEVQIMAQLV